MARIDTLLSAVPRLRGSDLHLLTGQPPKVRIHGQLQKLNHPVLTQEAMEGYLLEIINDGQRERFLETGDLDFAYGLEGVGRFRVNYYKQLYGFGAVFRLIPAEVQTIDDLGLPQVLKKIAMYRKGLVLVTGPTGSGKSTTLAAMIDYINSTVRKHIVTIEEPVEFVHQNKKSIITQREVGDDTESFASALRASIREDSDVILVGEMRDTETMQLAISAAEMGVLVFATVHTNTAAKTIDRIIDAFPHDQQSQVRTMLSESLASVISQLLLRRADKDGRIAAFEILISSPAVANMIRENKIASITNVIESGKGQGMQLMDDELYNLASEGIISGYDAYMKATDKKRFTEFVDMT